MIKAANLNVVMYAAIFWRGEGSIIGLGFNQLILFALVFLIIMPLTMLLARPMRQLEMVDDAARDSGVIANRTRVSLMVLGVALTATVSAAADPIAFIALAAPQITCHITRSVDGLCSNFTSIDGLIGYGFLLNRIFLMFKGGHFDKFVILLCVRWYLAYNLSLRNLKEMMVKRGIDLDHSTVHRWVHWLSPKLLERFYRRSIRLLQMEL